MNAIVLGQMTGRERDPWIVWIGSTAPDAKDRGVRRLLPAERARLQALDEQMSRPRVAPADSLRAWAHARSAARRPSGYRESSREIAEAYRVTREPSSHGGRSGWRVTVWRSGDGWWHDVTPLDLFAPAAPPGPGVPLPRSHVDPVLAAVHASSFWSDSRPIAMGLDGYRVFYEGLRDGRSHERAAWCPTDAMFAAFESLARSSTSAVRG